MTIASDKTKAKPERHLPGEVGIWMFIFGDMMVFALFFNVFIFERSKQIDLFVESQTKLNLNYGVINTLLMISSSWFVALAVRAARRNLGKHSPTFIALAFANGLGFVLIKFLEYGEKIQHGITLTTNDFFMYYYMFTGIHFLHVLIGLGVLAFTFNYTRKIKGGYEQKNLAVVEVGATFWHVVDVLWIVLFPLLYLVK